MRWSFGHGDLIPFSRRETPPPSPPPPFLFTFHDSLCLSTSSSSLLGAHVAVDESIETIRQFRVEQTYAVKTGKWYFEFEALSGGDMRVGWARPACRPDVELGTDDQAYVFDGYRVNSIPDLITRVAVLIFLSELYHI